MTDRLVRRPVLVVAVAVLGAPSAALAAPSSRGGVSAPSAPDVVGVRCVAEASVPCRPRGALLRGRTFVVRGANLDTVATIVFRGRSGRRDDVHTRPLESDGDTLTARVPERAHSGRLVVSTRWGARASTRRRVRVAHAPEPVPIDIAPASRFFFGAHRRPSFSFTAHRSMEVQVELVNQDTGETVRSWTIPAVANQTTSVRWGGRASRAVAPTGSYAFRVGGAAQGAVSAAPEAFLFADHLFPIRGRHNLGYANTNNFGGGRGHKGQDMFASCGTKLAAARGGRVEYAGYHSAAGNYVVIDGAGTGQDYVYMHMLEPPLVETGQRVFTGETIGEVGETGRATGCHLHFELWSAPGWYNGGRAFDPLPSLKLWDSYG